MAIIFPPLLEINRKCEDGPLLIVFQKKALEMIQKGNSNTEMLLSNGSITGMTWSWSHKCGCACSPPARVPEEGECSSTLRKGLWRSRGGGWGPAAFYARVLDLASMANLRPCTWVLEEWHQSCRAPLGMLCSSHLCKQGSGVQDFWWEKLVWTAGSALVPAECLVLVCTDLYGAPQVASLQGTHPQFF